MTFHDLPADWEQRSLDDPALTADVLDLVVGDADRRRGGVTVLLTQEGRLVQPVFVAIDHPVSPVDRELTATRLGWLAQQLGADTAVDVGVVVAVVRETGAFVTDDDRAWHDCVVTACRDHGVSLQGMYLVTRHVVRPFPQPVTGRVTA